MISARHIKPVAALLFILASSLLNSTAVNADSEKVRIEDFSWLDKRYMEGQVEKIDELTRMEFGTPVRGNLDDLELLQRIIYRGLIAKDDTLGLQALGAVLGNVIVAELGLEWKVYEDQLGRSRAACVPRGRECLFPMTMLSRRMAVGQLPDVERIYNEALAEINPHLQKSLRHEKPSLVSPFSR